MLPITYLKTRAKEISLDVHQYRMTELRDKSIFYERRSPQKAMFGLWFAARFDDGMADSVEHERVSKLKS